MLAASAAIYALVVMVAWQAGFNPVLQLRPGIAPIQFNTALGLAGLTLAALLALRGRILSARCLILLPAALAVATLVEYVGHVDLGIDQAMMLHHLTDHTSSPGRMSPATAFSLLVGAIGVSCLTVRSRWAYPQFLARASAGAMVVAVIDAVLQAGWLTESPARPLLTQIAPQTVVILLSLVLTLLLGARTERRKGALIDLERVGAWVVGILITLSFLMWQTLERKDWWDRSADTTLAATAMARMLEARLLERSDALKRLTQTWEIYGEPTQQQWKFTASQLLGDLPELKAVLLLDPQYIVRWRVARDDKKMTGVSLGYGAERIEAFLAAAASRQVQVILSLELASGGRGLVFVAPIYVGDQLRGYMTASFSQSKLFDLAGLSLTSDFSVLLRWGRQVISERSAESPADDRLVKEVPLRLLGRALSVDVWPHQHYLDRTRTGLPEMALALGLMAAVFVAIGFGLLHRSAFSRVELQRLGRRLETTLESIADAFMLIDRQGKVQMVNSKAEQLLQRERASLTGRSVLEALPEMADSPFHRQLLTAFDGEVPVHFAEYAAPLGKWIDVNACPSQDGLAVYFRDITRERQLQEQLQQAQRMEAIGQLTGGVAHDFNNLLTVMLGNAELLSEELAHDERLNPLAVMVVEAAQRGADLTQRMLAFARRQPLAPEVVDVNLLIGGLDPLLRRALGEHIEIAFVHENSPCLALVDPAQLESALLNLCINARDAMSQGGKLTVDTANVLLDADCAAQQGDVKPGAYVQVGVSDTGCGIAPADLARVFEPFFTTKEQGKGTGLGLAMVYGLVKQSDGHVTIYSEPGHGTTVRLYLPRAQSAVADVQAAEVVAPQLPSHATILMVEDDALVRQFASGQLENLGYQVLVARDGASALEVIRARADIDLLFTDVVMPGGMNGRQLADAALVLQPQLKVLFTSGYTSNAIVHHGRLEPGVRFLAKPYRRNELAKRVKDALDAPV